MTGSDSSDDAETARGDEPADGTHEYGNTSAASPDAEGANGSTFTRDDAVRDVLRGAGVVYVGLVAEMGLAFVAQRFAAVHLSLEGFGNLTAGTAVLDVGAILAGLGLAAGLRRYLPRVEPDERKALAKYAILLSVPAAFVVAVPIVVFAEVIAARIFSEPGLAGSLRIFGAAIPFAAVLNIAVGGIRGQQVSRFRVYVRNLLHPGARFGLIMIAVVLGAGEAGFALAYVIPFALAATLGLALLWRALPDDSNSHGARQVLPEFLRYSLPFTVSGLASFVYRSLDIFLLVAFVGSGAVGTYAVAYAFAQLMGMFSTAFSFLSSPVSSRLESENRLDDAMSVQTTIARWVTIASVAALIPMVSFAPEFLRLIYRPAYAAGGTTLVILVLGFAFKNTMLTHGPILEALGKSKITAVNTAAAAVVNLLANLALIPRFGIEGAALATTASFVVLGGLPATEVWYYTRQTTLSREVISPVLLAVPLAALAIPLSAVIPGTFLWTFGTSAAIAGTYVTAVVVVVGFTETDVMVVRSIEDRFGVPLGPFEAVLERFS